LTDVKDATTIGHYPVDLDDFPLSIWMRPVILTGVEGTALLKKRAPQEGGILRRDEPQEGAKGPSFCAYRNLSNDPISVKSEPVDEGNRSNLTRRSRYRRLSVTIWELESPSHSSTTSRDK